MTEQEEIEKLRKEVKALNRRCAAMRERIIAQSTMIAQLQQTVESYAFKSMKTDDWSDTNWGA